MAIVYTCGCTPTPETEERGYCCDDDSEILREMWYVFLHAPVKPEHQIKSISAKPIPQHKKGKRIPKKAGLPFKFERTISFKKYFPPK